MRGLNKTPIFPLTNESKYGIVRSDWLVSHQVGRSPEVDTPAGPSMEAKPCPYKSFSIMHGCL